jgi:response regulator RpfG family c-di-GMP phosphodiesterase
LEQNQISILYVDDEPINLMLFEAMFYNEFKILTFESPVESLEYIRNNNNLDVVVSDMRMPKLSGVEFIREAIKVAPSITYFILTGFDVSKEIEEALKEDLIKECFQKPFEKEELVEAISKYLK